MFNHYFEISSRLWIKLPERLETSGFLEAIIFKLNFSPMFVRLKDLPIKMEETSSFKLSKPPGKIPKTSFRNFMHHSCILF